MQGFQQEIQMMIQRTEESLKNDRLKEAKDQIAQIEQMGATFSEQFNAQFQADAEEEYYREAA